jgi:hypothetical protein
MARRADNVFGLSFLDAITCGFGAVVLFFMVINASVGLRADRVTTDLRGEVELREIEVLEGYRNLVELRNSARELDQDSAEARGLSARLLEQIREIQQELATYDQSTLARIEHLERLKADLRSLEEDARRLSESGPVAEETGDDVRAFVGDGDRQYLTGFKVGGQRILILVDASGSMLGDTIVNILIRRNLPDEVKIQADKWQQAVRTVDWLTTQMPPESQFQIFTFNVAAAPVIAGSEGQWLDGSDRQVLDEAVAALKQVVPADGTSLVNALSAVRTLQPPPDNLILLVDGLPTQGESKPRGKTVSGTRRARLFERALRELPRGIPVNVILYPMEGDPAAAPAYWALALSTRGSFMSPAEDWP